MDKVVLFSVLMIAFYYKEIASHESSCTKSICKSIYQGKDGVYVHCDNSVKEDEESKQVCAFIFVTNSKFMLNESPKNPNKDRCNTTASGSAIQACKQYSNTYSPFKGEGFKSCYSSPTSYVCQVNTKTYLSCTIKATSC